MTRICEVTGRKPISGHNVSHAKNRTKRKFRPNLHAKKFFSEAKKMWLTLRVSSKGMRTIDRHGVDAVLEKLNTKKKD